MRYMFYEATAFAKDISFWRGPAATSSQYYMFYGATAYADKFWCTDVNNGPASSCFCRKGGCFLHDGSFHNAIKVCLEEAPVDGVCTSWGTE